MSSGQTTSSISQRSKAQRVLACVLCQQRKVKCDRKFPCANCLKARVQCVPATQLPRRRKRRFPERELLDQLRKYEDLLRQNSIRFEPLRKDALPAANESPHADAEDDSNEEHSGGIDAASPATTIKSEHVSEVKYALSL